MSEWKRNFCYLLLYHHRVLGKPVKHCSTETNQRTLKGFYVTSLFLRDWGHLPWELNAPKKETSPLKFDLVVSSSSTAPLHPLRHGDRFIVTHILMKCFMSGGRRTLSCPPHSFIILLHWGVGGVSRLVNMGGVGVWGRGVGGCWATGLRSGLCVKTGCRLNPHWSSHNLFIYSTQN